MNKVYTGELAFLNESRFEVQGRIRAAEWLKNEFQDDIWHISFNGNPPRTLNFGVRLEDGSMLTENRHAKLLGIIKSWLCAQTHPSCNEGRRFHPETAKSRVFRTLHIIDYLLMNAATLKLAAHGLEAITRNDITNLVTALCQHTDTGISIYQWPAKLRAYLLERSADITADDVARARDGLPGLDAPYEGDDAQLELDRPQLLQVRAWLWRTKLYSRQRRSEDYYRPDVVSLSETIFSETLWGKQPKAAPPELLISASDSPVLEKRRVPVRNFEDDRPDERKITAYLACLQRLSYVIGSKTSLSQEVLRDASRAGLQAFALKESGRTRTLPEGVVMLAFRRAADFVLDHGALLVNCYISLAKAVARQNATLPKFLLDEDILGLLPPEALALGIRDWSIRPAGINTFTSHSSQEYFNSLRANHGLCELLKVLSASISVVIGTLMARRGGELHDLRSGHCLDESGRYLIFANRKSGEHVHRMDEARPIPKVASDMLQMLQRLHQELRPLGFTQDDTPLLASPARLTGKLATSLSASATSLDLFCDYFELPGDGENSRFYIRQHQLRRFFAIAFFWGAGFGGLDTLRWFLGHMDPKHIWHYVTEGTPGEVLRQVRVDYAKEQVLSSAPEADALADVLVERFGTRNFALVDSAQLTEYVDALIGTGTVTVEPHFFSTEEGERFTILIQVTERRSSL